MVKSAKIRKTVIDHLLFYGPPGLGKTSLATVIANEMNAHIVVISASTIKNPSEIVSIIGTLDPGDVLFIDEIHNLLPEIEEILYSAMEDFKINITYRSEENTKALNLDISPFTLIGATTMASKLSLPFRNRFGMILKFNYYNENELSTIIEFNAKKIHLNLTNDAINEISSRSRMTPRIAINLLKRIYDFAICNKLEEISLNNTKKALKILGIYKYGLTELDVSILKCFHFKLDDSPTSIETIATILNEDVNNIKLINEPYLVNKGFIERTKRGRVITEYGITVLNDFVS